MREYYDCGEGEPPTRKLPKLKQLVDDIEVLNSKISSFSIARIRPEFNAVRYIDEQKTLCLVNSKYIYELVAEVENTKMALDSSNRQLSDAMRETDYSRRESSTAIQKVIELYQLLLQAVETNGLLEKELKRSNTELIAQSSKISELFANQKIQMINHVPVHSYQPSKMLESRWVQTDYWKPTIEFITRVEEPAKPKEKEQPSEMEQRLTEVISNYESQFESLSSVLSEKLKSLSYQHLIVRYWANKNRYLTEYNTELKQQMKTIELEKAKVLLWRDKVESRIKLLEEGLFTPLPIPIISSISVDMPAERNNIDMENAYLKGEVQRLRGLLLYKKLQASMSESGVRLAYLFKEESKEFSDSHQDGSIVRLVSLSEKLREVAKWITYPE